MDYETEVVGADTGLPGETPTAEPQPEVKEVETPVETPEPKKETPSEIPAENLVELPDGRKLSPKEAEAEYRNLYSEFTRKSQKLATYEKDPSKITNEPKTVVEKTEWVPQTWDEVLEKAAQSIEEKRQRESQAEQELRQKNETYVSEQLADLKKENPTLNETQLFNHALKYNFSDLKVAYSNMRDMQSSIKKATEETAKNIQKRNAEPVNGGGQGGAVYDGDVYDPSARNTSLVDYLRSIK